MAAVPLSQTYLISDASLKAYYPLDNSLNDSSPSGLNLTNNGSTDTATAQFGTARNFVRASSQYATNTTPTQLRVAGDKTVVFWMYINSLPGGGAEDSPDGLYDGTGNFFGSILGTGPAIKHTIGGFSGGVVTSSVTPSATTWYRIAYRLSGTTHDIFVNKTKSTSTVSGSEGAYTSSVFSLGRPGNFAGQYFNGIIDDYAFFTRALSDAELDGHYDGTLPSSLGGGYIFQSY